MKYKGTTFLIVPALVCMLLPISFASAQITADEFNSTLDPVWRFNDPRADTCALSTQSMTGTQAQITVPGGSCNSDPYPSNQAPRLVQQVAPFGSDVGQFAIWAKFDNTLSRTFQIEGVEAIQDNKNFVRCEIYYAGVREVGGGDSLVALLFSFDNAGSIVLNLQNPLPSTITGSTPLSVRLDRINDTFSEYYSTNEGATWIQVNAGTHIMNVDSVAVYAATADSNRLTNGNPPALTCLVDYFRTGTPLPVQLASFSAVSQNNSRVLLQWTTISETNNYGFEVQKSLGNTRNFETIQGSFLPGYGTSLDPHQYNYVDGSAATGNWYYRLKQIDLDGTIHYSDPVYVDVLTSIVDQGKLTPSQFALQQNYPNPFNPSTSITYDVPKESRVTLEVFNLVGQKVATLIDEVKPAGFYSKAFNASALTSGVYMYKLSASGLSFTRKMVLMK